MTYRWLQKDVGGTITLDEPLARADSGATWVAKSGTGATLATGAVTLDSVNTTLGANVAAGALALSVVSAAGVVVGRKYLVGSEWVTVAAVNGLTLTLARPVLFAQVTTTPFVSTRMSAAIPGSALSTIGRANTVWFTYEVGAVAQPGVTIEFDITRYSLKSGLTLEHVRDIDPLVTRRASQGTVWPALIESSWERMMSRVGLQHSPGGLVGAIDLTMTHSLDVLLMVAQQSVGEEARATATVLAQRLDLELSAILASRAFDENQDGIINPREGFYRTFQVSRG